MSSGRPRHERAAAGVRHGRLAVTSAALDRASVLRPLSLDRLNRRPRHLDRVLGHSDDLERDVSPTVVRGKSTIVSLASDRRAFELADGLATGLVDRLAREHPGVSPRIAVIAARHREATRFLMMHDFVGVMRPLVEASELAGPCAPRLPALEVLARRAIAELDALHVSKQRAPSPNSLRSVPASRLNVADAGRERSVPTGFVQDFAVGATDPGLSPPARMPFPSLSAARGSWRAYQLLRATSCPPALAALLSRATERILAGRLETLSLHTFSQRDLSPLPVAYWSNLSLRSVFHASERRARGLPTIGLFTMLTSDHPRYRCDVFDVVATVGTGQVLDGFGAYRLPGPRGPVADHRASARHAIIALQPAVDIVCGLVKFARLALACGWRLSVRPHPVQRRDRTITVFFQREVGGADSIEHEGAVMAGQLVVTGTSNLAIEACLKGCPVILVCTHPTAAGLWAGSPPPGHVVEPATLECSSASGRERLLDALLAEARSASARFVEHYEALPVLH